MDISVNSSSLPRLIDPRTVRMDFVDKNKLEHLLVTKPHEMGIMLSYAFGTENSNPANVLSCLTEAIGNVETVEVDNDLYRWDVVYQNNVGVKIITGDSSTNPGLNRKPVTLVLEEKAFSGRDKVKFYSGQFANIIAEPVKVANGWEYTFQFANPNKFFTSDDVKAGNSITMGWTPVGEASKRGGYIDVHTATKYQNILTTTRIEHTITGAAMKQKIVMAIPTAKGDVYKWIEYAKWEAMRKLMEREERALIYGEYSDGPNAILSPDNGRPIMEGSGIREQISSRNKMFYTDLSYDLFMEYLMNLSYASNGTGGDHKFVALTGRRGMLLFDAMIQAKVSQLAIKVFEGGQFIDGKGMNMKYGSQFKTCMFPNGIEVTVAHCKFYDEYYENQALDAAGWPLESSRFTIMKVGNSAKGANLKKVIQKGMNIASAQVPGMVDIDGNYKQGFAPTSTSLDGAEFHLMRKSGIILVDPLSAGELIPNLLIN
jgi:hypothetical protein